MPLLELLSRYIIPLRPDGMFILPNMAWRKLHY